MPRSHDCSWRKLAEERGRALEQALAEKAEAEAKLETAMAQIAEYERRLFGRTTERVVPIDRELKKREAEIESEAAAALDGTRESDAPDGDTANSSPRRKRKRKQRPEQGPRIRNECVDLLVINRRCPHCGKLAERMGNGKFTTEWDYVPGYFVRRQHNQEVICCKSRFSVRSTWRRTSFQTIGSASRAPTTSSSSY